MAIPDHGTPDPAVQVTITFAVPMDTILNPGPMIYPPDEPERRERLRREGLPETDAELLERVQEILELKEAVQSLLLARMTVGAVRWSVERPPLTITDC